MKSQRYIPFLTLLILVLPLMVTKPQEWQPFSGSNSQLSVILADRSQLRAEQINTTFTPTQMPLPPVTKVTPSPSSNTIPYIAGAAIAAIVVALLIWRFRIKKRPEV
jgi:hypothetical protein